MTSMSEAQGRPVYAAGGERLGDVETILEDVETRRPEWIAIGTAPASRTRLLIPVEGSELRDDGVFVKYSAAEVRATPKVEGDEISQETERQLYSHYGLAYSERRSATGLPERPSKREGSQRSRSGGRGREGEARSDEPTRDQLYEEAKRLGIKGRSRMKKRELMRAVETAVEATGRDADQRRGGAKANPVEVQKFLEGISYPMRKRQIVQEAKRQGASEEVRSTLERLPDERFDAPTDVSEAIGQLA
jgi:Protein of unknown function (DUF2795)/Rho termination factor, N-terminal domain/PRC-barrel domain